MRSGIVKCRVGVESIYSIFAYRSIGCCEAREHVLVASLLLLMILLDLLFADSNLVLSCFVFRIQLVNVFEIHESFVNLAERQMCLTATIKSLDVVRVQAESFIALKVEL